MKYFVLVDYQITRKDMFLKRDKIIGAQLSKKAQLSKEAKLSKREEVLVFEE